MKRNMNEASKTKKFKSWDDANSMSDLSSVTPPDDQWDDVGEEFDDELASIEADEIRRDYEADMKMDAKRYGDLRRESRFGDPELPTDYLTPDEPKVHRPFEPPDEVDDVGDDPRIDWSPPVNVGDEQYDDEFEDDENDEWDDSDAEIERRRMYRADKYEGKSFDKFMDKILIQEGVGRRQTPPEDNPQRRRAKLRQDRPINKTHFGIKK